MADPKASGELLALILDRVEETAKDVKALTAQHADTQLSLNDGRHVMSALRKDVDGLIGRVAEIERRHPTPPPVPVQASVHAARADDGSDHRTPAARRDRHHEPKTDAITRGVNVATLVKIGALIGAAIAGYTAASKLIPTGGAP